MPAETKELIAQIKGKIRLLGVIGTLVTFVLLGIIFFYLYSPFEASIFLPSVSVSWLIGITAFLSVIAVYLWITTTRHIGLSIEEYSDRIDRMLTLTKDLREETYGDILLDKVMEHSLSMTASDDACIMVIAEDALEVKVGKGEKAEALRGASFPLNRGFAGWVATRAVPMRSPKAELDPNYDPAIDSAVVYPEGSVLCAPLILKGKTFGVLELTKKIPSFYTERDEEILSYITDHAAVSLTRAQFYEDQKNYEIHVTDILLDAIDNHVPEKSGHSKRVAQYANILAKALQMSEEERKRLYFASLLHDVGFLKLKTQDIYELDDFRRHPVIGYEMIHHINFYSDIAPLILSHHEKYDGTGYPAGLKGEEIPLGARIIAVAEAFDAMSSDISYRIPIGYEDAIQELKKNAGSQFDFWITETFISNLTPEQFTAIR